MLVLRRRPSESILFDGGLKMTLVGLQEHRAWLGFVAPCLPEPLTIAALSVEEGTACLGIRAPRLVGQAGSCLEVRTGGSDETVLLVKRAVGEQLGFAGMTLTLQAIEQERAVLRLELEVLPGPVDVSIFSVTGAEAKIGIEAPREVRVFREEVWQELEAANTQASAAWSETDLASLSTPRRPPS
jgi:carbon storage regulator